MKWWRCGRCFDAGGACYLADSGATGVPRSCPWDISAPNWQPCGPAPHEPVKVDSVRFPSHGEVVVPPSGDDLEITPGVVIGEAFEIPPKEELCLNRDSQYQCICATVKKVPLEDLTIEVEVDPRPSIDPKMVEAVKKAVESRAPSEVPGTSDVFSCPVCLAEGVDTKEGLTDMFTDDCLWALTNFAADLIAEIERLKGEK